MERSVQVYTCTLWIIIIRCFHLNILTDVYAVPVYTVQCTHCTYNIHYTMYTKTVQNVYTVQCSQCLQSVHTVYNVYTIQCIQRQYKMCTHSVHPFHSVENLVFQPSFQATFVSQSRDANDGDEETNGGSDLGQNLIKEKQEFHFIHRRLLVWP